MGNPDATLDLIASRFRVTPEVIRFVLMDKPEFEDIRADKAPALSPKSTFARSSIREGMAIGGESIDEQLSHPDFDQKNEERQRESSQLVLRMKNNPFLKRF